MHTPESEHQLEWLLRARRRQVRMLKVAANALLFLIATGGLAWLALRQHAWFHFP